MTGGHRPPGRRAGWLRTVGRELIRGLQCLGASTVGLSMSHLESPATAPVERMYSDAE